MESSAEDVLALVREMRELSQQARERARRQREVARHMRDQARRVVADCLPTASVMHHEGPRAIEESAPAFADT